MGFQIILTFSGEVHFEHSHMIRHSQLLMSVEFGFTVGFKSFHQQIYDLKNTRRVIASLQCSRLFLPKNLPPEMRTDESHNKVKFEKR